jgi:hypothetical protein
MDKKTRETVLFISTRIFIQKFTLLHDIKIGHGYNNLFLVKNSIYCPCPDSLSKKIFFSKHCVRPMPVVPFLFISNKTRYWILDSDMYG